MNYKQSKELKRQRLARMYQLAQDIETQDDLDRVLMTMADPHSRGVFFELLKPMIKRFEPEYTEKVRTYRRETVH